MSSPLVGLLLLFCFIWNDHPFRHFMEGPHLIRYPGRHFSWERYAHPKATYLIIFKALSRISYLFTSTEFKRVYLGPNQMMNCSRWWITVVSDIFGANKRPRTISSPTLNRIPSKWALTETSFRHWQSYIPCHFRNARKESVSESWELSVSSFPLYTRRSVYIFP